MNERIPKPRVSNASVLNATVFIVDDDPDVRRALSLLTRSVGLKTEQYASGLEFLERFNSNRAGCLVLDMRMPGMSGLELQGELVKLDCCLPIIFVSAHGEVANAAAAMRAGAIDFIRKPYDPQMLLERIHEAIGINGKIRIQRQQRAEILKLIESLTERECEIMQMLAKGDSTKLIASQLGISPKTVDNHRAKVLEKLAIDNVAQLARLAALLESK